MIKTGTSNPRADTLSSSFDSQDSESTSVSQLFISTPDNLALISALESSIHPDKTLVSLELRTKLEPMAASSLGILVYIELSCSFPTIQVAHSLKGFKGPCKSLAYMTCAHAAAGLTHASAGPLLLLPIPLAPLYQPPSFK